MKRDLRIGEYLVQPQLNRIVSSSSEVSTLEPKVMDVLVYLADHPGEVLTKEAILGAVWPDTSVTDDVLKHSIFELRKALGDNAAEPRYVETISRRGYRLTASVSQGVADATVEQPAGSLAGRTWVRACGYAGLAVLTGLIGLKLTGLTDRIWGNPDATRIRSLAVLPLENFSGDTSQEYFADGMTDALITELSKIRSLRIISRTSTMQYKGGKKALPEMARELDVDGIVEGSVFRAGESVRITVQLIQATPEEKHLWADSYEGKIGEILGLQRNVSSAIARAIRAELTPDERKAMERLDSVNPRAYEAYLKGRHHWSKRTPADFDRALGYFQQAIDEDPSYASAYVGLADGHILLGASGLVPSAGAFARARAALAKALEIDPSRGDAHASLALVKGSFDWDWAGAERESRLALELSPNYATAHHWHSGLLARLGRWDEALASIRMAQKMDPLSSVINTFVAEILWQRRQFDQALEAIRAALELDPDFLLAKEILGRTYLGKGRYEEAVQAFRAAAQIVGHSSETQANLGYCLAVAGQTSQAGQIAEGLEQQSRERYVSPYFIALVHAGMGDKDRAFEWLERAYEERSSLLPVIVIALWDPLRDDPRYEEFLRKLNLPEDAIHRHLAR